MNRKGLRLSAILLLSLIVTVITVLAITMFMFLRNYQQSLMQNARTTSRRTIALVSNTVDEYLDDIDKVWVTLEEALEDSDIDREDFFNAFLKIRPDVVAVTTYSRTGELVNCYNLDHTVRPNIERNLSFNADKLDQYATGYISAPHVVSLFDGYYPWVVTMIMPLQSGDVEAWAALDISCSNISAYISDIGIGQRGYCFLIDTEGNIVYHPKQQLIYSALKSENTELISTLEDGSHEEGTEIFTIQSLRNGSWRVVGVTSVQEVITDSLHEMAGLWGIATAVVMIATIIISAVLFRVLSRPINDLASAMKAFEEDTGSFVYAPVGGAREVRELSDYFGHMVEKIQELMATVRSEEVNLRKTELRALQAQINPHFLYNTLDSVSLMCEQGRNDDAVTMVNALARLFRISISKGHELIPIRNEAQHAQSYLQIQSVRYKNQFSYTFQIEEGCLDYLCNKITLQPIIENAIYHGINGLVDEGEITICVRSEGEDIIFTVEDNGIGMEPEQVKEILRNEQGNRMGIGIKNVNDRLKIFFGEHYGISIQSVPDEGTCVIVRMPKITEEAEYEKR